MKTTSEIAVGDSRENLPEFGRIADVTRLFGLRRGTLYTLINRGAVKSVLLRIAGKRSGVRLVHLDSVRQYIHAAMAKEGK
jgi:hypothetical protein